MNRRELLHLTLGTGAGLVLARSAEAAPFAGRTSAISAKFYRGTLSHGADSWAANFNIAAARAGGFAEDASLPFESAPGIIFTGQLKGGQVNLTLFEKSDGARKNPIGTGVARVTGSKFTGTYTLDAGGGGEFAAKLEKPDKRQLKKLVGTWDANFVVFDDLPIGGQISISANGAWQAHDLYYFDGPEKITLKQRPTGYLSLTRVKAQSGSSIEAKAHRANFTTLLNSLPCCLSRDEPCCETETERQARLRTKAFEAWQATQVAEFEKQGSLLASYNFDDPGQNRDLDPSGGEPIKASLSRHR